MKIILKGRPKSTNHIYDYMVRGRRAIKYMNKKSSELKESYIAQLKAMSHITKLSGPLFLGIEIYWYGIEPDRDNLHKLTMDSCNGIVWDDDKQIKMGLVLKQKKENEDPRIIITVVDISDSVDVQETIMDLIVDFTSYDYHRGSTQKPRNVKSAELSLFSTTP